MNESIIMYVLIGVALMLLIVLLKPMRPEAAHATSPQLTVYGYMGCPYTVKQLNLLKSNNIPHQFVQTDQAEGAAKFSKLMKGERSGVPVTVNHETGKLSKGLTELSQL